VWKGLEISPWLVQIGSDDRPFWYKKRFEAESEPSVEEGTRMCKSLLPDEGHAQEEEENELAAVIRRVVCSKIDRCCRPEARNGALRSSDHRFSQQSRNDCSGLTLQWRMSFKY
jgi:hypothetical protein